MSIPEVGFCGTWTPRGLGAGTLAHHGPAGTNSAVLKWIRGRSMRTGHVLMQPRHPGNASTLAKLDLRVDQGWNNATVQC